MGSSFVAEERCGGIEVRAIEESEAKWWMDGASKSIVDGRFESALSLLRKAQQICPTLKGLPELTAISQVCHAGAWRPCSCSSRRGLCQTPDWYRILEVDEKADADSLKKRYRQLALLLHPDKNDHVNSEGAFKLVSKAYECLSDNHKRHMFNLERSKSFCVICSFPPLNTSILAAPQANRTATYACQSHFVPVADDTVKGKQDAERLHILQERAREKMSMFDEEWGSRHSRWLQQLASVREKFRTYQYDLMPPLKSGTAYAHSHLFSSLDSHFHWSQGEYKRNAATSVTDLSFKSMLAAQSRSHEMHNGSHQKRAQIDESLDNLLSRLKPKSKPAFQQVSARTEKLDPECTNVTIPVEEGETIMKEFLEGIRKFNRPVNASVSPLSEIGLLYTNVEPTTLETYHSLQQGQSVSNLGKKCPGVFYELIGAVSSCPSPRKASRHEPILLKSHGNLQEETTSSIGNWQLADSQKKFSALFRQKDHGFQKQGRIIKGMTSKTPYGKAGHARSTHYSFSSWKKVGELDHKWKPVKEQENSQALMGILDRLREEAKSIAATLNKLHESNHSESSAVPINTAPCEVNQLYDATWDSSVGNHMSFKPHHSWGLQV